MDKSKGKRVAANSVDIVDEKISKRKKAKEQFRQGIASFFCTGAIPFSFLSNHEFVATINNLGKTGTRFKLPSYHDIGGGLLSKDVQETISLLESFEKEWKMVGCTIMLDGWRGRKKGSICNILVNSPKGNVLLASIDTSCGVNVNTAERVFETLDEIVDLIGEENVVQVVTDDEVNHKLAADMLMKKRERLFWTPCASHCVDSMLRDMEKKLEVHRTTLAKGRVIYTYIYSRRMLRTWFTDLTKGKELIRPTATMFATSYLALTRLNEKKEVLMSIFSSTKWKCSRFAASPQGKRVQATVMDSNGFWEDVVFCLKAAIPLIKVLSMVDSNESPAMGFIYEAMHRVKEKIAENFNHVKESYGPVWDIIDQRWKLQLHSPLHAAAYFLNPQYHYLPTFRQDKEVKLGFYSCLEKMVPDKNERAKIVSQIDVFTKASGLLGREITKHARTTEKPACWWDFFGVECHELSRFAIRILSLTCSSSGCERNWTALQMEEMIQPKRRNLLYQKSMKDLPFVMFNMKLKERLEKLRTPQYCTVSPKPSFLTLDDIDRDWATENEQLVLPEKGQWVHFLDKATQRELEGIYKSDEDESDQGTSESSNLKGFGSSGSEDSDESDDYGYDDTSNE